MQQYVIENMGQGQPRLYQYQTQAATGLTKRGTGGVDYLVGTPDNDTLSGGNGDDNIWGRGSDDTLNGGAGRELLEGGAGSDTLSGGNGDDWLYGNHGNETYTGGAGDDVFVFGPYDGEDTITDYTDGKDIIHLVTRYPYNFDQLTIA